MEVIKNILLFLFILCVILAFVRGPIAVAAIPFFVLDIRDTLTCTVDNTLEDGSDNCLESHWYQAEQRAKRAYNF